MSTAKLQPKIQVLQSTTPVSLQESTVPAAVSTASQVIQSATMLRKYINIVHVPVFVDYMVLMGALLIFKILISRFASILDVQSAQAQIAEACSYFRNGINDFDDIPRRATLFLEVLYQVVMDGHLRSGGFVIENTKYRDSQNILYEVSLPVSSTL